MKVQYHILVWLILLSACKVFQPNHKETTKNSIKENLATSLHRNTQSSAITNRQQFEFKRDSVGADYKIYFWPRGQLNLSGTGALTGEFDSVLLIGKRTQLSTSVALRNDNKVANRLTDTRLEQDSTHSQAEVFEKKSGFSLWSIVGLVTGFIVTVLIIVKIRK
jgi:hypothetical protein